MRWLELTALVDAEAVESVAEVFREHGQGGVSIEEAIEAFSDREGYLVRHDKPVAVRTYLPLDDQTDRRRQTVEQALWYLGRIRPVGTLETRELDEEDWANAWKEHYHVLRIGERIVIRPTWREYAAGPGEHVIDLDPGMAFGTGLHPTTRLCLVELERLVEPSASVLDVGTGSGILAIAAARLGAHPILALDVDPIAVTAARQNAASNDLSAAIPVEEGSVEVLGERVGSYDLVVANIIARVLCDLSEPLVAAARPGGWLIAGGIIDERLDEVQSALAAAGLEHQEVRAEGDWRVVVGRRRV